MDHFRHWMMLCETESPDEPIKVAESAPPGKKAERFIKKHKKEFKQRYGKRGTEVLYATAWKKFGESMTLHNYLSLIEDLRS
jgi:hypothetical protein